MNISNVSATANTDYTQQTKSSGTGYSFTQIMEKMRSTQKTASPTAAAGLTAEVRTGLDAETLMYLDKYTVIYNKYAAKYGDGFELVRTQYCDGSASDAEESKRAEGRTAFYDELYEAGIPGYGRRVTVEDFQGGTYNFEQISLDSLKIKYNNDISSLFYAEKYGLAGLSKEEQLRAVLGAVRVSTVEELSCAAQMLYLMGAISAYDTQSIQRNASMYATQSVRIGASREEYIAAQRDTKFDWNAMLETLKDNEDSKDIYELLSSAWEIGEDDAEGEKLKAILEKVDAYQDAIHKAIELSNKKRRELELLDRAAAESARLRILFSLDNGLHTDTDLVPDTTGEVML